MITRRFSVRLLVPWSAVLAAAALAGCGDDTSGSKAQGGMDGSLETSVEGSTVEGSTVEGSTVEGSTVEGSTVEGSTAASPDASADGTVEAATDASMVDSSLADADASREGAAFEAAVDSGVPPTVVAEPGYSVTLWASGTTEYFNPDSIDYDGAHYWVGFQNTTTKDGSDGGAGFGPTSTIVEYTADGSVLAKYAILGHNDGLRFDPTGHKIWATSNEDGSPHLFSIDPSVADASAAVVEYTIAQAADAAAAAHGGGYDDLRFFGGSMFVAASNPSGAAHVQSLDVVSISGTTATFLPVLFTDSNAIPVGADASSALALTDPDSIAVDDRGRLVLVSQADSQLVFVSNPGASSQSVSVLTIPTQVEDPVWITRATGRLLLVDGSANAIYEIHTSFAVGTVFAETPNDSTIPGIFATLDPTTGVLLPKIVGFRKPTGLVFVPGP